MKMSASSIFKALQILMGRRHIKGIVLAALFVWEFSIHVVEYYGIEQQKLDLSRVFPDDSTYDYPLQQALSSMYQNLITIIFLILLYYTGGLLRLFVKTDFQYLSIAAALYWLCVHFPVTFINAIIIDKNFNLGNMSISTLISEEIIKLLSILTITYIITSFYNFVSRATSKEDVLTPLLENEISESYSFSSQSESTQSSPSLHNDLERNRSQSLSTKNLIPIKLTILFSVMLTIFLSVMYTYIRKFDDSLINPVSKLGHTFSSIFSTYRLVFNEPRQRIDSAWSNRAGYEVYGFLHPHLYVNDNLAKYLNEGQLSSILISAFYLVRSNMSILINITYMVEILLIPLLLRYILKSESFDPDNMDDTMLVIVIPALIITIYPVHYGFGIARNIITNHYYYMADKKSIDLGRPIEEAIIQMYSHNKDLVIHNVLYSYCHMNKPTLKGRLLNIAVYRSKIVH